MAEGGRKERLLTTLAVLLVAGCVIELLWETWKVRPQIDDAYISYRYARNLAEGLGLVYNPGERVEGFTNLLFTLLVAGGVYGGLDARVCGHALGVGSAVVLLISCASYAATGLAPRRRPWAALAPWLLLSHPALVRWAESGMESTLFAATLTLALAVHARQRRAATTACLMAAALTRPEGALFAAILFAFDLRSDWRDPRRWAGPAALGLLLVALTTFRVLYFGSPLPNTFHTKVSMQAPFAFGAANLGAFLGEGLFLWLPALVVAPILERRFRAGAAVIVCGLLYVIAIGGDATGPTRFFLPVLAPMAALAARAPELVHARLTRAVLLLAVGAGAAWQLVGPPAVGVGLLVAILLVVLAARVPSLAARGAAVGVLLGFLLAASLSVPSWRAEFVDSRRSAVIERVRKTRGAMTDLAERQARDVIRREPDLVALAGIGYFGFVSRLPVLDLLGLVDATIARTPIPHDGAIPALPGHQRSNADYVVSRRPDYILMRRWAKRALIRAHRDLHDHPDFARLYVWDAGVQGYRLRTSR